MTSSPIAEVAPGSVWLVGAGPGDPGLLTLLADQALRQADVVIYDALVSEAILARASCLTIYAGKRGGTRSTPQNDIIARMVAAARRSKRVVRLKGGDPCIFGRGGEEALALHRAGIPFRIVPGISAGSAALTYAGIPMTHRDMNHAVMFVTGHDLKAGLIDWQAAARAAPVIVAYMVLKNLPMMVKALSQEGRAKDEPVAIISHATLPTQEVLVTDLAHCVAASQAATPPCIVVVGPVVRLHEQLRAWCADGADGAAQSA